MVVKTHVNLVDLLDGYRTQSSVHHFRSEAELRAYTIENMRYFPKEDAYEGGLLKWLLREIHNSYHGNRGRPNKGQKKGRR